MDDIATTGSLWISLTSAVAISTLVLLVVGVPLARVIGLRGFTAVAVGPAFAMTIISVASVTLPVLHVGWSAWGVAGVAIVVGLILGLVRWLSRRHRAVRAPSRRFDGWLLLAFLTAASLITARTLAVLQSPDAISQTYDNVFHLNAVRWVLDTGTASSFDIGLMTNPEGPASFYPSAWHGLVALVAQLSGASVPVAINGVVITVSAVVWPLGILLLCRTLFGRSAAVVVAAALVAASVPAFPLAMMDYGVLYPFQLGIALLPSAVALTARLLRLTGTFDPVGPGWWAIAVLGTLPGLALVHPGALMAWLALSVPMVAVAFISFWRATSSRRRHLMMTLVLVVYLAFGAAMVYALRPPPLARGWQPEMGVNTALAKVVTVSPWYAGAALLVALGVVLGIVWAVLARTRAAFTALGLYAVTAALFVVVTAIPFPFRDLFTASWYNNIPRIAAIFSVALVPLTAYGFACSWMVIARRLRRHDRSVLIVRVTSVAAAILLGIGLQIGPVSAMPEAQRVAAGSFALTEGSPLLSSDEALLLSRVDEHVPEGERIAGSPWTGTSLAYALAGREVLMPHIQMVISDALAEVNDRLTDATPGSATCDAVEELHVGFVLDFGPREVHGASHPYPGLEDLSQSTAVRLVDSEGDARLYEVTGCER